MHHTPRGSLTAMLSTAHGASLPAGTARSASGTFSR